MAEGAPLLREYTVMSCIKGSNPFVSAKEARQSPDHQGFFVSEANESSSNCPTKRITFDPHRANRLVLEFMMTPKSRKLKMNTSLNPLVFGACHDLNA